MKRTILGIAAAMAVTSIRAQGIVHLDNYTQSGNLVLYGAGVPGGTVGTGILNQAGIDWTIGIYGAIGNVSVASDATGTADPSTLGPINLLSGSPGDTTTFVSQVPGQFLAPPGYFAATADAFLPGWTSGTATFVIVAYSGSTYDSSDYRGHSAGFNLAPVGATSGTSAPNVGNSALLGGGMPGFSVLPVLPEPSVFTLSSIGGVALLLVRRKK